MSAHTSTPNTEAAPVAWEYDWYEAHSDSRLHTPRWRKSLAHEKPSTESHSFYTSGEPQQGQIRNVRPLAYGSTTSLSHELCQNCLDTGVEHGVYNSTVCQFCKTDGKKATPPRPEDHVTVSVDTLQKIALSAKIAADNIVAYSKAGHTMYGWLDDACTQADIASNEAKKLLDTEAARVIDYAVLSLKEQQPAQAEIPAPPDTEPLGSFEEGQWWVKELDALVHRGATPDQVRAVAVVHRLLRAVKSAQANQKGLTEDYTTLFDAISAATKIQGTAISVSVEDFRTSIAASQPGKVPEGWQLVPKQPTQEMIDNVASFVPSNVFSDGLFLDATYRAMLAAAPVKEWK